MEEALFQDMEDIAEALGAPRELNAEIRRLIEHFDVASMHADEQAVFLLEVGRLIHDTYAQRVEEVRAAGGGVVPPYVECARLTVASLLSREVS